MHKHVKPADAAATILDPGHGRALPPEGAVVPWSAYWAGLEARGDVKAKDVEPEPQPKRATPKKKRASSKRVSPKPSARPEPLPAADALDDPSPDTREPVADDPAL